ncbi:MAG TPA: NADH-quinone oxidoreductase subunit L, partial [Mucilaginibacter sp.]
AGNKNWLFKVIPFGAVLTTWLTAFYVARLIIKVFFGEFKLLRNYPDLKLHISDGGWLNRVPLMLLCIACLFPVFSLNPLIYEHAWLFSGLTPTDHLERVDVYHTLIPAGVNILSLFIIYSGYSVYVKREVHPFPQSGFLYRLSYHQWYFDKAYHQFIVKPILALSRGLWWIDKKVIDGFINLLPKSALFVAKIAAWIDHYLIDGTIHLLTRIVESIGNFARGFQSGKIQYYLFSMLVIILALFILKILI